jgi:alkanesulfonate monooxygenase SsuD/methylene tetrahydromethanopterin reductase-like flavin-dependent oxidoreductase (luciferase family)
MPSAQKAGRPPDHIKILPGCLVVVGDTEEARKKRALLGLLDFYVTTAQLPQSRRTLAGIGSCERGSDFRWGNWRHLIST